MSRVEPKHDDEQPKREGEQRNRLPVSHTPGKAEGEEGDIEEALRRQEPRTGRSAKG